MKVKERRKKKVKDDIQVADDEINFEENFVNILKAGEPKVSRVNNRGH